MKLSLLLGLLPLASGFSPASLSPRALTSLRSDAAASDDAPPAPEPAAPAAPGAYDIFSDPAYVGNSDFRGKRFDFDPLGLAAAYPPFVPWFRECELRHGRTAMIAVLGFIATDFMRLPGEMYSFEAIPKTIDAHDALLKSGPMYQVRRGRKCALCHTSRPLNSTAPKLTYTRLPPPSRAAPHLDRSLRPARDGPGRQGHGRRFPRAWRLRLALVRTHLQGGVRRQEGRGA